MKNQDKFNRTESLSESIGNIDNDLIERADSRRDRDNSANIRVVKAPFAGLIAAALILTVGTVFMFRIFGRDDGIDNTTPSTSDTSVTSDDGLDSTTAREYNKFIVPPTLEYEKILFCEYCWQFFESETDKCLYDNSGLPYEVKSPDDSFKGHSVFCGDADFDNNGRTVENREVRQNDDGRFGIFSKDGRELVPFVFYDILMIGENSAFAKIGGCYGIIAVYDEREDYISFSLGNMNLTDERLSEMVENGTIHQNVTRLYLNSNEITDVSPLKTLKNLKELYLYGNEIKDISMLSELNLEILDLSRNPIDLESVDCLTTLSWLFLDASEISDISPLKSLTNLEIIGLRDNQITDISPLKALTNLETVDIIYNQISDISPLKSLTNLKTLSLDSNSITDFSPLYEMKQLKNLSLSETEISDVTPFAELMNLEYLAINFSPISDLTPLFSSESLKSFDFGGCPVPQEQEHALWLKTSNTPTLYAIPMVILTRGSTLGYNFDVPNYHIKHPHLEYHSGGDTVYPLVIFCDKVLTSFRIFSEPADSDERGYYKFTPAEDAMFSYDGVITPDEYVLFDIGELDDSVRYVIFFETEEPDYIGFNRFIYDSDYSGGGIEFVKYDNYYVTIGYDDN
ncbi:MAG: leucine-rich repeat domain-containing protein [Oscillospiraceae bacterium]|nr:leucine-rich repeat domain-containing protein [Oscillospiraceae bacterium]